MGGGQPEARLRNGRHSRQNVRGRVAPSSHRAASSSHYRSRHKFVVDGRHPRDAHPMRHIVIGLLFSILLLAGQLAFEVSTVKPAVIPTGAPEHYQYHMTMSGDAARVEIANASMMDLMRTAFRVDTYQISGPAWMDTVRFDIVAKIPEGATREQVPEMLQQLLTTRFGLTVHRSQDEHNVLALVTGKNGPNLKETPPDSDAPAAGGFRRSFGSDGSMQMEIRRYTTTALAELLGRFLNRAIADATGLKGAYDVSLAFSPQDLRAAATNAGVSPPAQVTDSPETDSTIAASLQRLGLKLERRKLRVDVIVVDHLDKGPTAN